MVRQSNTVCRNVRRKPAHSVEHKGFRIFGWSLPAPCKLPEEKDKAKGKDHTSKQRRERVEKFIYIHATSSNVYRLSNFISSHRSALHTTHNTPHCTLCALSGRHPCLESGSSCLSAQSEAWGAIRAVGLTDHVIVWTNWFQWLLHTHTSWPNNGKRKIRIHYKTVFFSFRCLLQNILLSQLILQTLQLTCPGTDCPEASLLKKHYPKSSFGLLHTLPLSGPETSSAERDETRQRGFLCCRYL